MKFLVVLFCFLFFCSLSAEATTYVRDTNGKTLRSGRTYYVLPVIRDHGGGLTLAATSNGSSFPCPPRRVVQARSAVDSGLPVVFSPTLGSEFVNTSTNLDLSFYVVTTCMQSTMWWLADASTGRQYILSGGVKGSPSAKFKIERYKGKGYKLVYCPSKAVCDDVGVFVEGGKSLLGLDGDHQFPVVFKKSPLV